MSILINFLSILAVGGAIISQAEAQSKPCTDCFHSEVIDQTQNEDGDVTYEMEVTADESCSFALGHLSFFLPCHTIIDGAASEDWPIEIKKNEFRIDEIEDFGEGEEGEGEEDENEEASFTFWVKTRPEGDCNLDCPEIIITYKAALCLTYDTLAAECDVLEGRLVSEEISCAGASDGAIRVEISNGVPPYRYRWSDGSETDRISGLAAGSYEVEVTDAAGNKLILETHLQDPGQIKINEEVSPESCESMGDGQIAVDPDGGAEPYSISWSNGAKTPLLKDVSAGVYHVTITDANGCTSEKDIAVPLAQEMEISAEITPASCNGSDGGVDVTVQGGHAPYDFVWSTGSREEDVANLSEGRYSVAISDSKGCTISKYYNVPVDNNNLALTLSALKTGCGDAATGSVSSEVAGGHAPYSYLWSTGDTTANIANLPAGVYSLTVIDANGCEITSSATVQDDNIKIYGSIKMPVCHGESSGSIDLTIINGKKPFIYQWSNGSAAEDLQDIPSGNFSVSVTDNRGCVKEAAFFVPQPQPLNMTAEIKPDGCSETTGAIDLSVSGGGGIYNYQWSNGAMTQDIAGLPVGDYTVKIRDRYGCEANGAFTVSEHDLFNFTCSIIPPEIEPVCGAANRLLGASNLDAAYSWEVASTDNSWQIAGGQGTSMVEYIAGSPGSSAIFTLTATTEDGCQTQCQFELGACREKAKECSKDFYAAATAVVEENCRTYTVTVHHDNDVNYGLSQMIISKPCGHVSEIETSGKGTVAVATNDPETGLTGIKIDDIDNFGQTDAETYAVTFKICENNECIDPCWEPVIAFKAGECVAYDTLDQICNQVTSAPRVERAAEVKAYPNPTSGNLYINLPGSLSGEIKVELINLQGALLRTAFEGPAAGAIEVVTDGLPNDTYFYKITSRNEVVFGRFMLLR